jgi:hypothetical protein
MILLGTIASSLLQNVDNGAMYPLQVITVGPSGASSVSFTNIPSTYTHLQIRVISRNSRASTNFNNIAFQVNGDTGSNYSAHLLRGDGSSVIAAPSTSASDIDFIIQSASGTNASVMGAFILDILDYANTNKYKTFRGLLGVDNNGSGYSGLMSGLWQSTSAITSIAFYPSTSGNITQNSQFALYGVKSA